MISFCQEDIKISAKLYSQYNLADVYLTFYSTRFFSYKDFTPYPSTPKGHMS